MLTQQRLKDLLHYDPDTGLFTNIKPRKKVNVGSIAGTARPDGYLKIMIDYNQYFSHRLAWFYVHGVWPQNQIDHINGNRSDNRISNLREANEVQNKQNRRVKKKGCSSKYLGVCWNKATSRWCAQIRIDGKKSHLGFFDEEIDAYHAYLEAKKKHHPFQTIAN